MPSATHGIERVLIVDWDVHDGNGTQDAFYPTSVLFFSLHQDDLYPPAPARWSRPASGAGQGFTVNMPLPAGSGDAAYLAAFERIVLPIANEFKPQLVLVSAGQDASLMDPLGRMGLSTDGYRLDGPAMIDIAEAPCRRARWWSCRRAATPSSTRPYCTLAIVETLAGTRTEIAEPQGASTLSQQPQFHTVGLDAAARRGPRGSSRPSCG